MKRFFKQVGIAHHEDGWHVLLDGKPIRTPLRRLLAVPTEALARAVAVEWEGQGEELQPATMRVTRLATTAVDLMPERRQPAIRQVMDYLGTDMLCYRASEPRDLVQRQDEVWQPWLDWLTRAFDVQLPVHRTVLPQAAPAGAEERLLPLVEALDGWQLVALHAAVTITQSLALGLAMMEAVLPADEAFEVAQLDTLYQVEHWGDDPEITRRHEGLRAELEAVERFVQAMAPPLRM